VPTIFVQARTYIVSTIAHRMRFGGIEDVGRGSNTLERFYGTCGDSVREDVTTGVYPVCERFVWTVLDLSHSVISDDPTNV